MDVLDRIKEQVEGNAVVVYMKGTPQFPMCGFSSRTVEALSKTGVEFGYINVIQDQEIYENLHRYADWPTFPQVYVGGELVGGCDITLELFEQGELQTMMEAAVEKAKPKTASE